MTAVGWDESFVAYGTRITCGNCKNNCNLHITVKYFFSDAIFLRETIFASRDFQKLGGDISVFCPICRFGKSAPSLNAHEQKQLDKKTINAHRNEMARQILEITDLKATRSYYEKLGFLAKRKYRSMCEQLTCPQQPYH